MLFRRGFKNQGSRIRRKACNIGSPYGVDWGDITLKPRAASLARGYQYVRPTVLL